jgi:hypothetical protein
MDFREILYKRFGTGDHSTPTAFLFNTLDNTNVTDVEICEMGR